MPEECRIVRHFPHDPLRDLKPLSLNPPPFTPIGKLTQEKFDAFGIMTNDFLLPQERLIAAQVVTNNADVFAWDNSETTTFSQEYFGDVVLPLKDHVPFFKCMIPWPPGLAAKLEQAIDEHVKAGIYEPCNSSYGSPLFWVVKKDGSSLRLVHDLQTLNGHTVRDATLPPALEQYVEWYACSFIYTGIDIMNGFYGRVIAEKSRDATAFDTPSHGKLRLTRLPQGFTNSMQVFQGDIAFILQDERDIVRNYADDAPVKARNIDPAEFISPGVRRVVRDHFEGVNRVLRRFGDANICVSAKKFKIGVPELVIVGHSCSFEGRKPDPRKIDKIINWPIPKDITGVRGFLGTAGDVRIFIHKFSQLARPLVDLTRKDAEFIWTDTHTAAMDALKQKISSAPCLRPIDYSSGGEVILAVDSSHIAVGWILSQVHEGLGRVPSRYGSATWNEAQSRYSQSKIELYGLLRALHAMRLQLIGLPSFTVEMDAKYVKGMINRPDLHPSAAINRWIAAILMFQFTLRHVPARDFKGPDGLSRREKAEGDLEEEDAEEWMDEVLGLGVWIDSWRVLESAKGQTNNGGSANDLQRNGFTAAVYAYKPSDSTSESSTTLIPRTLESIKNDNDIDRIKYYLSTLGRPSGLQPHEFKKIVSRSREFFIDDGGQLWKRSRTGMHQKVIAYPDRLELLIQAHDKLGHKSKWSTRRLLLDRVWWPRLEDDVEWFNRTCHECQLRSVEKMNIPPSITFPATLFAKVHIDTMLMPPSFGKRYLIEARCSLTSYVECRALKVENARSVGAFIFEDILCRWGAVLELVTDNGSAIKAAVEELTAKYSLHHIKISPYNSRANGVVERAHRSIRDALVKTCEGDIKKWAAVLPYVAWSDRVTIRKAIGMSPFQMAHGIEPVLPMDALHATYLAPKFTQLVSTNDLISIRAKQLMHREEDLAKIHERVVKSRYASIIQFKHDFANRIKPQEFEPGTLVLVRNVKAEYNLGGKHLPRYFGPLMVVSKLGNGAYKLSELDGSISNTRYAGYRLLPYYARDPVNIPITMVYDNHGPQSNTDEGPENAPHTEEDDSPPRRSARIAAQQTTG
jgi:hypothetical protein